MSKVNIRVAKTSDLTAIVKLLDAQSLPTQDLNKEKLTDFLVADVNGSLVGVVGLEIYASDALLRSLAVSDRLRGTGLGKRLLREIERCAAGRGVSTLYLLTTTASSLFTSAGYQPYARDRVPAGIADTQEFASLCPDSAVCLRRTLVDQ